MTPEVEGAVAALSTQYGADAVLAVEDRHGGAYVVVEGIPLGEAFVQDESWIGFHIPSTCPYADVYPHFVRADLARSGGGRLGEGFSTEKSFPDQDGLKSAGAMPARQAVQISRRSNRKDSAGLETPLHKLLKVIEWLNKQ